MGETSVCRNLISLNLACHHQFSAINKYGMKIIYIRTLDYFLLIIKYGLLA